MKNFILCISVLAITFSISIEDVRAQGMMSLPVPNGSISDQHDDKETQGKAIWEKIRTGQASCGDISERDFELIGDYSMGLMAGDYHEFMDQRMERMMGPDNTEQMHIVMGKRFSGCDTSASMPGGYGYMSMMPMMGMINGGFENTSNFMGMRRGYYGGFPGWIASILWLIAFALIIVLIIRFFSGKSKSQGRSALDFLRERYAKGEINKEEFESKKRDLS